MEFSRIFHNWVSIKVIFIELNYKSHNDQKRDGCHGDESLLINYDCHPR